jgi:hypothetical protein
MFSSFVPFLLMSWFLTASIEREYLCWSSCNEERLAMKRLMSERKCLRKLLSNS